MARMAHQPVVHVQRREEDLLFRKLKAKPVVALDSILRSWWYQI